MSHTPQRARRGRRTALRTGAALALATGSLVAGVGTAGATTTPTPLPIPSLNNARTSKPAPSEGAVKIHAQGTPVGDSSEQTHVCRFYLDVTGFKPDSTAVMVIVPTAKKKLVYSKLLKVDAKGAGHTSIIRLHNGHYVLGWGSLDQRDPNVTEFWVKCAKPTPSPTPSSTAKPTPAPTSSTPSTAPAPTPVRTDLPVTG